MAAVATGQIHVELFGQAGPWSGASSLAPARPMVGSCEGPYALGSFDGNSIRRNPVNAFLRAGAFPYHLILKVGGEPIGRHALDYSALATEAPSQPCIPGQPRYVLSLCPIRDPTHFRRLLSCWVKSFHYRTSPVVFLIISPSRGGRARSRCMSWRVRRPRSPIAGVAEAVEFQHHSGAGPSGAHEDVSSFRACNRSGRKCPAARGCP